MTDTFKEEWMTGPEGHQFYTRTYAAPAVPSAIILFVHGFAEHIGRYEHIHSKYPTRNITLFTFDQRGYGRTALDVAHRSKDSAYGKTNWTWQMGDIEHFATYLAKEHPGVPLFLMGHSMGGGLVLAYFTRPSAPPSGEGVKLFSGVIACSPFLTLTTPKPKLLRWTGAKLASLAPYTPFPADPGVEFLSRDPAAKVAYWKDPLIKRIGTLKGLDDMLTGGETLVAEGWTRWPKNLPVLFIHGTGDGVTSPKSTEKFYTNAIADDKKLSLYEGGFHELALDIDGLPERLFDECVSWVNAHIAPKIQESKL